MQLGSASWLGDEMLSALSSEDVQGMTGRPAPRAPRPAPRAPPICSPAARGSAAPPVPRARTPHAIARARAGTRGRCDAQTSTTTTTRTSTT